MERGIRTALMERAGNRCEYCQRPQDASPLIALQIEHVIPRKHGGTDDQDNLAIACPECNLRKSSNLAGLDPESGALTPLFNPRTDDWDEHFELRSTLIVGRTAIGRTTVQVLGLNVPARIRVRRRWLN